MRNVCLSCDMRKLHSQKILPLLFLSRVTSTYRSFWKYHILFSWLTVHYRVTWDPVIEFEGNASDLSNPDGPEHENKFQTHLSLRESAHLHPSFGFKVVFSIMPNDWLISRWMLNLWTNFASNSFASICKNKTQNFIVNHDKESLFIVRLVLSVK